MSESIIKMQYNFFFYDKFIKNIFSVDKYFCQNA